MSIEKIMKLEPYIHVKAAFADGTEVDKVMSAQEADAYMHTLATNRQCTHFEGRGLWNQDKKAYDFRP